MKSFKSFTKEYALGLQVPATSYLKPTASMNLQAKKKKEDYDRLFDSLGQYLQCCQTNNTYLDVSGKLVGDAITGPSGEAPNKMRYIGGIERFPPDSNPTGAVPFYPPVWKGLPLLPRGL